MQKLPDSSTNMQVCGFQALFLHLMHLVFIHSQNMILVVFVVSHLTVLDELLIISVSLSPISTPLQHCTISRFFVVVF